MKDLESYLFPTQDVLFNMLRKHFRGTLSVKKRRYLLVPGEAPIMLIAHLDTVHKYQVKDICRSRDGNIIMSPQGIGGDDRCGVYALVSVYDKSPIKPWLLFTCDEEVGGVGAECFAKDYECLRTPKALRSVKALIEIDRKGSNDAVYYSCGNKDFEQYITSKGFETDYGSYSDISDIAPAMEIAAVNLSSGYYNAHTQHEYINREHLESTIRRVVDIVADSCGPDFPRYEYVESAYKYYGYGKYMLDDYYDLKSYYGETNSRKVPVSPKIEYVNDDKYEVYAPDDLPVEYAAMYEELLDFYTYTELEELRKEYGDKAIKELYEAELGPGYDSGYSYYDSDYLK